MTPSSSAHPSISRPVSSFSIGCLLFCPLAQRFENWHLVSFPLSFHALRWPFRRTITFEKRAEQMHFVMGKLTLQLKLGDFTVPIQNTQKEGER
jgi:hypothetical protein